ncbi:MAG TPA: hypothetical protein VMG41_09510 [Gemmatimonadales bacterium]|nr:hypothetical protein [Gemmatimonadales bacterium]
MTEKESAPGTDLTLLLSTERELALFLDGTRRAADDLVRAAQADAQGAREALDREIKESEAHLRADIEAERGREAAVILDDARRQAAELDGTSEARVGTLADFALESLLRGMRQ